MHGAEADRAKVANGKHVAPAVRVKQAAKAARFKSTMIRFYGPAHHLTVAPARPGGLGDHGVVDRGTTPDTTTPMLSAVTVAPDDVGCELNTNA